MELTNIRINNFKSIGDKNNEIVVNNNLISLVGKNEAGKTNILQALSRINKPIIQYIQTPQKFTFQSTDKNRVSGNTPSMKFSFILPKKDKSVINVLIRKYHLGDLKFEEDLSEEFHIVFKHGSNISHSGIVKNILEKSTKIDEYFKLFFSKKNIYIQNQATPIQKQLSEINSKNDFIDNILSVKIELSKVNSEECRNTYSEFIGCFNVLYNTFSRMIPTFLFVELPIVKEKYNQQEFQVELGNKNSFFSKLFDYVDFDVNTIMPIFTQGQQPSNRRSLVNLNNKIDGIVADFNKRNVIDKIKLEIHIEKNELIVYLDSDIVYGERSEGFKQAFNLFLSTGKNDEENQKYIFLIDEPDKSLHIRAQSELLKLFNKITKQKNYIIYTTHSPFMINAEDISSVKLVEKKDELTEIKKNMYSQNDDHISKMETLTPVYHAIGYAFSDKLGPVYDKINIIVEGKWDKIYLECMMDYFKVTEVERPCIIASVGATNIPNISKILMSWGINVKIILDNDKAGRKAKKELVKFASLGDIYFIKECTQTLDCKGGCVCDFEIEDITYINYKKEYNTQKEEFSLKFRKELKENSSKIDDFTIDNYKRLFLDLGIKFS